MGAAYWEQVLAADHQVLTDRRLEDLTAELMTMLGSVDADLRDAVAYPTLATWVERGGYDGLLVGLGEEMATGLLNVCSVTARPASR